MAFVTNSLNFPNLTAKGTPVGGDLIMIADSAASNALKQATITNILAAGGGAGALTKIATVTASNSAAISFTGNITSTYDNYILICSALNPASTGNLTLQFGNSGSYTTSGYLGNVVGTKTVSGVYSSVSVASGTTAMDVTSSTAGSKITGSGELEGIINIYIRPGTGDGRMTSQMLYFNADSASGDFWIISNSGGKNTVLVTDVRLLMNTGNIQSGVCTLYGFSM